MSDEYDNNPKATDPGTQSEYTGETTSTEEGSGMFTDRPAFKRNKSADPGKGLGGVMTAVGVKSA